MDIWQEKKKKPEHFFQRKVTYPDSYAQMIKNLPANVGDMSLIPGSGRSPEEGNGNPLRYSCLGSPTDRGAWHAADTTEQLSLLKVLTDF